MKDNNTSIDKGLYVPFDHKYLVDSNAEINESALLGLKSDHLAEKIKTLYEELYRRREINYKIISEVEKDLLEASSEIENNKCFPHINEKQLSVLERRVDLLEKTKRSELVEYWKDAFKLNMYLVQMKGEQQNHISKQAFLK
jgi:hypothetical protein